MASKKGSARRMSIAERDAALAGQAGGQRPIDLAISELYFDPRNPRLPEAAQSMTQEELLTYIAKEYQPIEIARSIAAHGYFLSEPLIVVLENGLYMVVEGNRRLAALRLL